MNTLNMTLAMLPLASASAEACWLSAVGALLLLLSRRRARAARLGRASSYSLSASSTLNARRRSPIMPRSTPPVYHVASRIGVRS